MPVLLAGAFGVLAGKPMKWLTYGTIASLFIGLAVVRAEIYFAVVPILILVFATRTYQPKLRITVAQAVAGRQKSIYQVSNVCSVVLLLIWLPIIFLVGPNRACRPMGQFLVTVAFILPATIVGIFRAIRQLITTWPEKRVGLKALAVALIPIAIYGFTQWLILSVCGIIYED